MRAKLELLGQPALQDATAVLVLLVRRDRREWRAKLGLTAQRARMVCLATMAAPV